MRKMLLVAILLTANSVFAQTASREQVLRLYDVLHIQQTMQAMIEATQQQVVPTMIQHLRQQQHANLTPEDEQFLRQLVAKNLNSDMMGQILEAIIPVYQKYFTDADIEQVIAFYQSPTGQKFLTQQPAMIKDSMAAVQPIMLAQMNRSQASMQREIAEYLEKKRKQAQQ